MHSLSALIFADSYPTPEILDAALGGTLRTTGTASPSEPAQILDTYDGALLTQGQVLIRQGPLLLWFDGQQLRSGSWVGKKRGAGRIAPEDLALALERHGGGRPLIPVRTIRLSQVSGAIIDDEGKTHVRTHLLHLSVGKQTLSLACCITLRGYHASYDRLLTVLNRYCPQPPSTLRNALQRLGIEAPRTQNCPADTSLSSPPLQAAESIKAATFQQLQCYLACARSNEHGIRQDLDPECLHEYRVNLRRIRSLLGLLKEVLDNDARKQLGYRFADLMRPTNALRDLDVMLEHWPGFIDQAPCSMHPALHALQKRIRAQRQREWRKLRDWLAEPTYQHKMQALQNTLARPENLHSGTRASLPVIRYAETLLEKYDRALRKQVRKLNATSSDREVHDLRIRFKKIRYCLEFFAPVLNPVALKEQSAMFRRLQNRLGEFNDCSVQMTFLHEIGGMQDQQDKLPSNQIAAIGALTALRHQTQQQLRQSINSALSQLCENLDRFDAQSLFATTRTDNKNEEGNRNEDSCVLQQ